MISLISGKFHHQLEMACKWTFIIHVQLIAIQYFPPFEISCRPFATSFDWYILQMNGCFFSDYWNSWAITFPNTGVWKELSFSQTSVLPFLMNIKEKEILSFRLSHIFLEKRKNFVFTISLMIFLPYWYLCSSWVVH